MGAQQIGVEELDWEETVRPVQTYVVEVGKKKEKKSMESMFCLDNGNSKINCEPTRAQARLSLYIGGAVAPS